MRERIKQVIKNTFEVEDIKDDISRETSEKWDSLKHLILISNLEAEFKISIEFEDILKMNSLHDIEKILFKLLKN